MAAQLVEERAAGRSGAGRRRRRGVRHCRHADAGGRCRRVAETRPSGSRCGTDVRHVHTGREARVRRRSRRTELRATRTRSGRRSRNAVLTGGAGGRGAPLALALASSTSGRDSVRPDRADARRRRTKGRVHLHATGAASAT